MAGEGIGWNQNGWDTPFFRSNMTERSKPFAEEGQAKKGKKGKTQHYHREKNAGAKGHHWRVVPKNISSCWPVFSGSSTCVLSGDSSE